jgi:hypothetical protein
MTDIIVYDVDGYPVDSISINDTLCYINGRVSKGEKLYYKGTGVKYTHHYKLSSFTEKYKVLSKSSVFYLGNVVEKLCFANKTGIFQEQYQPHFTDYIGACGVKELSMIENSIDFEFSSAEVIKIVEIDKTNKQFYLILNYKCHRKKFNRYTDIKNVKTLVDYMVQSNWNFPWDKDSISDITDNGLICDTADIFKSKDMKHVLGSVYSIIYSLYNYDKQSYYNLLKLYNLQHTSQSSFVFNSIQILKHNNLDVSEFYITNDIKSNYINVVLKYLVSGKNCADCNLPEFGENVRKQYIQNTIKQLSA